MSPRPLTACPLRNPGGSVLPARTGRRARQGALPAVGAQGQGKAMRLAPNSACGGGGLLGGPVAGPVRWPALAAMPAARPRCCYGNRRAPPAASGRGRDHSLACAAGGTAYSQTLPTNQRPFSIRQPRIGGGGRNVHKQQLPRALPAPPPPVLLPARGSILPSHWRAASSARASTVGTANERRRR